MVMTTVVDIRCLKISQNVLRILPLNGRKKDAQVYFVQACKWCSTYTLALHLPIIATPNWRNPQGFLLVCVNCPLAIYPLHNFNETYGEVFFTCGNSVESGP